MTTVIMTSSGPIEHQLFLHPVTAPALILVGAMMAKSLKRIRWEDPTVALPCFLVVIGIPLSFSIAHGISFGILAWVLIAALAGRIRELSPGLLLMAGLLVLAALASFLGS